LQEKRKVATDPQVLELYGWSEELKNLEKQIKTEEEDLRNYEIFENAVNQYADGILGAIQEKQSHMRFIKGTMCAMDKVHKKDNNKAPVFGQEFMDKVCAQENFSKVLSKEIENQFHGDGIIRDRHILSEYFDSVSRSNFKNQSNKVTSADKKKFILRIEDSSEEKNGESGGGGDFVEISPENEFPNKEVHSKSPIGKRIDFSDDQNVTPVKTKAAVGAPSKISPKPPNPNLVDSEDPRVADLMPYLNPSNSKDPQNPQQPNVGNSLGVPKRNSQRKSLTSSPGGGRSNSGREMTEFATLSDDTLIEENLISDT
jgi:hypothetical protein